MIIKKSGTQHSTLTYFDLLGSNEVALSKAFAYLLGSDKDFYFEFLKFLDIKQRNSQENFFHANITIEKVRAEGRTDIEILFNDDYHIIVECKIDKGQVETQRTQYLSCFNSDAKRKLLCFLTQERDTNKQIHDDVTIRYTSWLEIIELYNNNHFTSKKTFSDFLKFATRNYKMKEIKEILIQDLGDVVEIERFEKYNLYRRDKTFGTPIYFAPYFTSKSNKTVGISHLAKVLGVLTFKPSEFENVREDLASFSNNQNQIEKWIAGIQLDSDFIKKYEEHTYYFLDEPLTFKTPLVKDGGIEKGRGKNWIAGFIPKNRNVSFVDFIKHIPELMDNWK